MRHYNLSWRVGQWQFASGIYFFLFTLSAVGLCAALTVWQWQRGIAANERSQLQAEQQHLSPVTLPIVPENYQRVTVAGSVMAWYLLDNRSRNGIPGREVVADVALDVVSAEIPSPYIRALINIGWQPRTAGLSPAHEMPTQLMIEGITKTPVAGFMLQAAQRDPAWPALQQHIDLTLLGEAQGVHYYPAVIYSQVRIAQWPLSMVSVPNKYHMHLGYALQWAGIGIACLILFLKISIRRVIHGDQQELAT